MVFGFGQRREQQEREKADQEVSFWKRELDKCVHEKNYWMAMAYAAQRQVRVLEAKTTLLEEQQGQLSGQVEGLNRKLEHCNCGAVTSRVVAAAAAERHAPSLSSPGSGTLDVESPGLRILQLQLSSSQARLRDADMSVLRAEEKAASLEQELQSLRAELECARVTSAAHANEANQLRSQLVAARGLGDDTAGQAAWLAAELQKAHSDLQKLRADASSKDEMLELLRQQLADYCTMTGVPSRCPSGSATPTRESISGATPGSITAAASLQSARLLAQLESQLAGSTSLTPRASLTPRPSQLPHALSGGGAGTPRAASPGPTRLGGRSSSPPSLYGDSEGGAAVGAAATGSFGGAPRPQGLDFSFLAEQPLTGRSSGAADPPATPNVAAPVGAVPGAGRQGLLPPRSLLVASHQLNDFADLMDGAPGLDAFDSSELDLSDMGITPADFAPYLPCPPQALLAQQQQRQSGSGGGDAAASAAAVSAGSTAAASAGPLQGGDSTSSVFPAALQLSESGAPISSLEAGIAGHAADVGGEYDEAGVDEISVAARALVSQITFATGCYDSAAAAALSAPASLQQAPQSGLQQQQQAGVQQPQPGGASPPLQPGSATAAGAGSSLSLAGGSGGVAAPAHIAPLVDVTQYGLKVTSLSEAGPPRAADPQAGAGARPAVSEGGPEVPSSSSQGAVSEVSEPGGARCIMQYSEEGGEDGSLMMGSPLHTETCEGSVMLGSPLAVPELSGGEGEGSQAMWDACSRNPPRYSQMAPGSSEEDEEVSSAYLHGSPVQPALHAGAFACCGNGDGHSHWTADAEGLHAGAGDEGLHAGAGVEGLHAGAGDEGHGAPHANGHCSSNHHASPTQETEEDGTDPAVVASVQPASPRLSNSRSMPCHRGHPAGDTSQGEAGEQQGEDQQPPLRRSSSGNAVLAQPGAQSPESDKFFKVSNLKAMFGALDAADGRPVVPCAPSAHRMRPKPVVHPCARTGTSGITHRIALLDAATGDK